MRKVDDFVKAHIDFTNGREGDPLYHKWAAMSCVSAALERRVWLDRGNAGGLFYPNMYVFLIGPSANGKTYAAELAVDHVKRIKKLSGGRSSICFTADKLTPAVLAEQLGEAQQPFNHKSASIIQSPLFAFSGELAVYLNDIGGGSLIPDLLRYYDPGGGPDMNIFRKRTVSKGTIEIKNPSVVLLGCTVPDHIRKVLMEASGYGLVSRTLFVVTHENSRIISDPKPEDDVLKKNLAMTLTHIHTSLTGEFRESKSATTAYRSWYVPFRGWFDKNRKGLSRIQEEYYGRKKVHIFKVAMCLSASRTDDLELRGEHIEEAIHLLDELEVSMFSITGNLDQKDDYYTRLERFYYLFPEKPDVIDALELRRRSISIFPTERELLDALRRLKDSKSVLAEEDKENKRVIYHRAGKINPFTSGGF